MISNVFPKVGQKAQSASMQSIAFTVFRDSEGKIIVALLCFRRLSRPHFCIHYVFEAPALQSIAFIVISRALAKQSIEFSDASKAQPNKVSSFLFACSAERIVEFIMFPHCQVVLSCVVGHRQSYLGSICRAMY